MDKLTTTLKKHWEKILLGLVLTLLAGGALFVVLEVPSIQAKLVEEVGYDLSLIHI